MTFVWESFPDFLVLGVLFNGRLIMLEEETRGRKMDFQNNIPSGCEERSLFLADNIVFSQCFCFPPFPSSLSLVHDSEGNLCADNKCGACKEDEFYSV